MYLARILYPVEVLGPGKRIGIWFCGCPHACHGCSNPELWGFHEQYATSLPVVMDLIQKIAKSHPVDGFTFTGGDPLYQKDDFFALTEACQSISDDILLYSGYLLDEIPQFYLKYVSVLIDGKYEEEKNNNFLLRGSSNQNIHILQEKWSDKYELYLKTAKNQIQNFQTREGIISVGIHQRDFKDNLSNLLKTKGME